MIHLGDWTAYWARRTPDAPALVEPGRSRRLTYRDLERRANRLAHTLAVRCGVRSGDRVAVLALNRAEHFEALFACAKLGALLVPLNWRLAAPELDAILADAAPSVLIYDGHCAPLVAALSDPGSAPATAPWGPPGSAPPGLRPRRLALDEPSAGGEALEPLLARATDGAIAPWWATPGSYAGADASNGEPGLEAPVVICYTSGTTGRAKGALLAQRQLVFNSLSTQLAIGLGPSDSTLVFMPLFHTGGLNCLATPILHHGGKVVVLPGFDAEEALAVAERERITLHMGVPTIFQMLADAPSFDRRDLWATRMALCGGAPCPLPLIERYRERGILFRQGYGLTEVGPNCFSLVEADAFRKAGSVGWPNFYLRTEIVDDAGNPVGAGVDGELRLGGPMVTLGYFRNPSATADAFRGTPWFHTGDLVRHDEEGYHYIVGRKKDMFISGGENVYPAEVEQAIRLLPGVAEVCVVPVADPRWGEVGRAVVVPAPGVVLDGRALLDGLAGKLARYKVPKGVVFAEALPRNASGKVLREMVRAQHGAS